MSLSKKIVLITGGSRGIGEATAYRFAQTGASLALTYQHDEAAAQQVKESCLAKGAAEVLLVQLDVANEESIRRAVKEVTSKYKRIDYLINNAGALEYGPLSDMSFEQIERQIDTNLTGLMKMTRECLPHIKTSIINIASALGLKGHRGLSLYSASKFGVRGFTQALAQERKDLKIYVVNPSLTATRMGGFKGHSPELVADVIFAASQGQYRVPRGGDINVRDYARGVKLGYWLALARGLKRTLKATIRK